VSVPAFVRRTPCFRTFSDRRCPIFLLKNRWSGPVNSTHNAEVASSNLALSTTFNNLRSLPGMQKSVCRFLSFPYMRHAGARGTVATACLPDGAAFRGHLPARGIESPGYKRARYTTKPNNGRGRMKGKTGVWERVGSTSSSCPFSLSSEVGDEYGTPLAG
jgi:hypothetical protein